MTEPEDPSRERLKHHFAQRVIHQARQILEIWHAAAQRMSTVDLAEMSRPTSLRRLAERFDSLTTQLAPHFVSRWKQ